MGKIIIAFLAIFSIVFLGIQGFIAASGKEKLQIVKVLGYSFVCTTLAILIASAIVILL
jgi:hypothetical protein